MAGARRGGDRGQGPDGANGKDHGVAKGVVNGNGTAAVSMDPQPARKGSSGRRRTGGDTEAGGPLRVCHEKDVDPKILYFEGHPIRCYVHGPERTLLFAVHDLLIILGAANPTMLVRKLEPGEGALISIESALNAHRLTVVNESGLYRLVIRSKAAGRRGSRAHQFLLWVTGTVLTSIRATGSYTLQETAALAAPTLHRLASDGLVGATAVQDALRFLRSLDSDSKDAVILLAAMPGFKQFILRQDLSEFMFDMEAVILHAKEINDQVAHQGLSRLGRSRIDGISVTRTGEVMIGSTSTRWVVICRSVVDGFVDRDYPLTRRNDANVVALLASAAREKGYRSYVFSDDFPAEEARVFGKALGGLDDVVIVNMRSTRGAPSAGVRIGDRDA